MLDAEDDGCGRRCSRSSSPQALGRRGLGEEEARERRFQPGTRRGELGARCRRRKGEAAALRRWWCSRADEAGRRDGGRRRGEVAGEARPWQDPTDPDGAALEGDARQRVEGGRDEGDRAGLRAREVGIGRWVRAMRRWREDEGDGDRAEGRLGLGSGVAGPWA